MSAKHTPGPWTILPEECDKPYIRVRGTVPGMRYKISNIITPTYAGVHERETQETRANARLIAAAPDLLKALKFIEQMSLQFRCDYVPTTMGDIARAAIAKAEGNAP